jgi:hypothetical protein
MDYRYASHGKMRNSYIILMGKLQEENHLEDLGVIGRIRLKCLRIGSSGRYLWTFGFHERQLNSCQFFQQRLQTVEVSY